MREIQPGDIVEWAIQAGGVWEQKRGTVLVIVPAWHSLSRYIPRNVPKSRIKTDIDRSTLDRVLVSVPRKSRNLIDYYAPRLSRVQKVDESR